MSNRGNHHVLNNNDRSHLLGATLYGSSMAGEVFSMNLRMFSDLSSPWDEETALRDMHAILDDWRDSQTRQGKYRSIDDPWEDQE